MVKVVEIFYSIQGEGTHVGIPCIFIRLQGCNLACSFCDELLHKGAYESLSFDEVLNRIKSFPSLHVIITGGEPSIYPLNDFIKFLQTYQYFVSAETNGFNFENIASADWVTYSPKEWTRIKKQGYDEIKFVVDADADVEKILAFECDKPMFIQPQNETHRPNMKNVAFCIEFVKSHPKFIFSAQLHKFLGVE